MIQSGKRGNGKLKSGPENKIRKRSDFSYLHIRMCEYSNIRTYEYTNTCDFQHNAAAQGFYHEARIIPLGNSLIVIRAAGVAAAPSSPRNQPDRTSLVQWN